MACSCMIGSHFTLYDRKILTGSLNDLESIQPSIGIGMTIMKAIYFGATFLKLPISIRSPGIIVSPYEVKNTCTAIGD